MNDNVTEEALKIEEMSAQEKKETHFPNGEITKVKANNKKDIVGNPCTRGQDRNGIARKGGQVGVRALGRRSWERISTLFTVL